MASTTVGHNAEASQWDQCIAHKEANGYSSYYNFNTRPTVSHNGQWPGIAKSLKTRNETNGF